MATTGQMSSHVAQYEHKSGRARMASAPCIASAPVGQRGTHSPQPLHLAASISGKILSGLVMVKSKSQQISKLAMMMCLF
jgi:hypothetical protein